MTRRLMALSCSFGLALLLIACSTTPTPTPTSIAVTGVVPAVGASVQFSAVATFTDGSTQSVTQSCTWTSSNAAAATVSTLGVVTGVADGDATITCTYQTMTGSDPIVIAG